MKKILLVANARKEQALVLAREAELWLHGKAEVLGIESDIDADLATYDADFVVVFGGDGTVLHVIHRLGLKQPPILTVNLGRMGYLAEVNPKELKSTLEKILEGKYQISERTLLYGQVFHGEKRIWDGHAVNEFVLASDNRSRLIEIEAEVDGRLLTRFSGDGIILASPTGSTAYALSAGGPIVNPVLKTTVMVPLCPHRLANRPLVLGSEETVTLRLLPPGKVQLTMDGRDLLPFGHDYRLLVRPADRVYRLLLNENMGRYDILRDKLGWGGEPCRQ
jgi:NAD+ kinase